MDPFVGEIRLFAGNYAPENWALCDGSTLQIATYNALYALLGTTYGGDGVNNFKLPDLRGRLPLHQGAGPGLANYPIGSSGGSETVTLDANQLPAHSHGLVAVPAAGGIGTPQNNLLAKATTTVYAAPQPGKTATLAPTTIASAGGNQPHDNLMPFCCINYIIALQGIYPTQN